MKTKVFISWSGETSKRIAEVFKEWIPAVLQMVEPYFTPNDIDKGARWSTEISEQLQESKVGIFCLTKENLNSKWMMFEAGAISKNISASSVCPILFDLDPSDVAGPLTQFQMAQFSKMEMLQLLRTINNVCGEEKLSDKTLDTVFEKWWGDLNGRINQIIIAGKSNASKIRSDRDLIEEILFISRGLNRSALGPELVDSLAHFQYTLRERLRGRTSTILGLLNLFLMEKTAAQNDEVFVKLQEEVYELDETTRDLIVELGSILGSNSESYF